MATQHPPGAAERVVHRLVTPPMSQSAQRSSHSHPVPGYFVGLIGQRPAVLRSSSATRPDAYSRSRTPQLRTREPHCDPLVYQVQLIQRYINQHHDDPPDDNQLPLQYETLQ